MKWLFGVVSKGLAKKIELKFGDIYSPPFLTQPRLPLQKS